jgi:hypothetical protein
MHLQCRDRGVCKSYKCQGRRMIVSIGDIAAGCVACGSGEFEPLSAEPLRLASNLKCSACGAGYTYLQLIDQIGEEAMRRANNGLDELPKKPPR